jgi:hypothetical protein
MELQDLLGGAALDFTLPSLGGVLPDTGCTCKVGGSCTGESACTNDSGTYCPTGYSACTGAACESFVQNTASCLKVATCGGATCTKSR